MEFITMNLENLLIFICLASFDQFYLLNTKEWFAVFHPMNQLHWPSFTLHVYLLQ